MNLEKTFSVSERIISGTCALAIIPVFLFFYGHIKSTPAVIGMSAIGCFLLASTLQRIYSKKCFWGDVFAITGLFGMAAFQIVVFFAVNSMSVRFVELFFLIGCLRVIVSIQKRMFANE